MPALTHPSDRISLEQRDDDYALIRVAADGARSEMVLFGSKRHHFGPISSAVEGSASPKIVSTRSGYDIGDPGCSGWPEH